MQPPATTQNGTERSAQSTGKSIRRTEDHQLVTGSSLFTADIQTPLLEQACHVAFVRSPFAAGKIERIAAEAAAEMPGVVATLGPADVVELAPFSMLFGERYSQPLLPSSVVSFAGQVVAAVVAETAAQAADAAEAVEVEIAPANPLLDIDAALVEAVIEETRNQAGNRSGNDSGNDSERDSEDEGDSFATDVVIELEQWSPRQLPCPIEGRSVAAVMDDERLLVWAATQTPHAFKTNLATLLQWDQQRIRVVAPAVGGGFGGKVSRTVEEYLIPLLAHRLRRPVRWNESRSEYFASATQGRGERITITLAGDHDGRISALRAHMVKDAGAFPLVGAVLPKTYTAKVANGCYDIAHVEFSSVAVTTNRPPTSAYRGAGRSPYIAALERTIDRYAATIGIDPAEVRTINLIRPEQMPYATPTGALYDDANYPADLAQALETAGYPQLRAEQQQRREAGETISLGIGIACYNHMTTGGGGEEATVTVESDGSATVITGSTSQGHGHATTWAQIAADVLRIEPGRIRVIEGDTDAIGSGVGAVGSRSLQTAGLAIHRASSELVRQAATMAAGMLEAAEADIVLADDGSGFHVVGTPARTVSWAEVVTEAPADEMTCGDFYDNEGRNTFPSGTHIAVVEVDTETGRVELQRLVAVDDAGTLVNPMIVEGQLHGGIASAIGQVLGEVVEHDETGNHVTGSLIDYPLPTSDQLPSFEIVASATPSSFNSLGFKGVGESGTVGATGAVHNAVIDAIAHLGVDHLDLPCTPQRVWQAIAAATAGR
ncbi:MAG: xanthine dehydrogenase family protein molybdopterin-binding subunit [Acidimicrobiales bacterium]